MKTYKITIASLLLFQVILSATDKIPSVIAQTDKIPSVIAQTDKIPSVIAQIDTELSWVDTQVDAIRPARVGINNYEIMKIQDPFIFYKKKSDKSKKITGVVKASISGSSANSVKASLKKKPKPMKLSTIINNSALIDGKWYRVNEKIAGFIVSSITRTNVVLSKGKKKLVLTTNDQNRNLKFK